MLLDGRSQRFLIPVSLHRKGASQQIQHMTQRIAEEKMEKGEWGAKEKEKHRL